MLATMAKSIAKQVDKGKRSPRTRGDSSLESRDDALTDLADCDFVIESVVEDLEVKRSSFAN